MRIARAAALGLVVAVAVAPAARAQKGKGGGMSIGPWVGVNFATFGGSSAATNTGTRTALAVGGQLQASLTPDIFLRVGALYSMRGATSSNPSGTAKLDYVEFPVVLGYQFPMQGVRPYVMAGGQFGFKAACKLESGGVSVDCNTGLGTSVAGTDLGVVGGAGVAFPVGRAHLMVDARYFVGFTNLISSAGAGAELKNKGFTVGAGYMIPIGH